MTAAIDASLFVSIFLEEPHTDRARKMFGEVAAGKIVVPGNFHLEVLEALLRAERAGTRTEGEIAAAFEALASLDPEVVQPTNASVVELARKHSLSAYDAGYLAVARMHDVPLATLDRKLEVAAKSEGYAWPKVRGVSPLIAPSRTSKRRRGTKVAAVAR